MSLEHVHIHPFRFFRTRGTESADEFFPHAGTKLAFQNRGVDTLQIRQPSVELQGGDSIKVTYQPTATSPVVTVFQGTVEQITETAQGGSDAWKDVLVASPWSKMDRLVFQQYWSASNVWSSNTILNQNDNGAAIGFKDQLHEIFTFAKTRCGVTATALYGGQKLPADEVRDLTCAQAVNRVLRWFPKKTVRLDYSGDKPSLELIDTTTVASWAASIDKSSIVRTSTAHPITGVYLETVTTGTNDGATYRILGSQKYPSTVKADDVDVLHATIMLAGSSSSNTYESMKTNAESDVWPESAGWWIRKHPRLAKYNADQIEIVEYSEREEAEVYPNITDASVEELTKFGLKARVEKFTAHVKIGKKDDDDIEEDVILQMKFVTSNAINGKTYRRMVGSSSVSSETIPDGLARAIYEDRSGSLQAIECNVRLGSQFPKIGETYEGLILQSFEVDVADLMASCRFGQPDHLSPDDMAGIMTGFRNRTRCASSWNRGSGKANDDDDDNPFHIISPVEATEFCPGIKSKTTFKGSASGSKAVTIESSRSGGNIELKTSAVGSGKTMGVHKFSDADGNELAQIMSTEDIEIPDGGGSTVEADGKSVEFTSGTVGDSDPDSDGGSGGGDGGTSKLQIKGFATAQGESESIVHDLIDGNTGVPKEYLIIVKDGDTVKYVPIGMLPDDMPKEITVDDDGKNCTVTPVKGTSFKIPLGKTISKVEVSNSASPGGTSTMVFRYSDGSSDTFCVQNGLNGQDSGGGEESSSIEVEDDPNEVRIFVDGDLSATIPKNNGPTIEAEKDGKVTSILVDGVPIATIADGEDGEDGDDGEDGKDGTDASVTVEASEETQSDGSTATRVTITPYTGGIAGTPASFVVKNGNGLSGEITYVESIEWKGNKIVGNRKKLNLTTGEVEDETPCEIECSPHSEEDA